MTTISVTPEAAVALLLRSLGVPDDEHTAGTPERVVKAYRELLGGYDTNPDVHLERVFPGPDEGALVAVHGVRFTSVCAHHLLPFSGVATIAYVPEDGAPIVGLSKLARVLEGYARRAQTQELLGDQVATALVAKLKTQAAGCVITAHHSCMGIRGVRQPDAQMTTSSLRGLFRTDTAARAELMALHHSGGTPA